MPLKENDDVPLKQSSPISIDSSASSSIISNEFADWNALLMILNDLSDFISTQLY